MFLGYNRGKKEQVQDEQTSVKSINLCVNKILDSFSPKSKKELKQNRIMLRVL